MADAMAADALLAHEMDGPLPIAHGAHRSGSSCPAGTASAT